MADCGCNGAPKGYGDAFSGAFGRAPVRDRRTRRLQKVQAGTGKAKGVQLAATLAAAMHTAMRGQPWSGGARVAAKARAQAAVRPQLAQLRADPDPTRRLTRAVQLAMSALGSSPSETALAVQYVLARSRGQTRATPREYLAAMRGGMSAGGGFSSGAASRLPLGVQGVPRSGGLRQGPGVVGLLPRAGLPGSVARFDPSARTIPAPAGFTRRQGSYTPSTQQVRDRLVGLLPRGAAADDDGAPSGTPAIRPLAPRLPGIRALPRLPGASLTPMAQVAENADEADAAAANGEAPAGLLSTALARFRDAFGRPGRDSGPGLNPGFVPGLNPGFTGGGFTGGGMPRGGPGVIPGGGFTGGGLPGDGSPGGLPGVNFRPGGGGPPGRGLVTMGNRLDNLDPAAGLDLRVRQDDLIGDEGLRGFGDLGAAPRVAIGASALDAFKPYLLPLTAAALLGFILSGQAKAPTTSPRRARR